MKLFDSVEEIIEAIATCEDEADVRSALKALVLVATHDRKLDKDDFPQDSLSGSVLVSVMILAVKNM